MNAHDRFEALAGAVVLGEASEAESAAFSAHAEGCAACRADVAGGAVVTAIVARERAAERWRPSIESAVLERIAKSRQKKHRRTVGAFGWAIAFSIVVNVAFASGITSGLAPNFHGVGEASSSIVTSRIGLEAARTPAPSARAAFSGNATLAHVPIGERNRLAIRPRSGVRNGAWHSAIGAKRRAASVASGGHPAVSVPSGPSQAVTSEPEPELDALAGLDISSRDAVATGVRRVAVDPTACEDERDVRSASERDFETEAARGCARATPLPRPEPGL